MVDANSIDHECRTGMLSTRLRPLTKKQLGRMINDCETKGGFSMLMKRTVVILGALACALPSLAAVPAGDQTLPEATDQKIQANILIVDSHDGIAQWAKNPKGGDAGRMRKVVVGQKIFVPIIVTGLKTTDIGQPGIVADMQFVAPGGKVMQDAKKCCGAANRLDPRTPGLIVLNPVLDLTAEVGDPLGTYEVKATVTYRGGTASASEKFVLQSGGGDKPVATNENRAASPKQRSRAQVDARHCLDAADNAAVIRCAEKYR